MKQVLLVVALALGLVACATPPPPHTFKWSKPGATYDEFLKDRYACITEGRSRASAGYANAYGAAAQSGEIIRRDIVLACLAARGYREDPNGFGPPEGGVVHMR